ncbi:hypothetical protein AAE478_001223 [Parahypoxylon ruwenzoriense]
MNSLARVLIVGLLALCYEIAVGVGAQVAHKQGMVKEAYQIESAPITTIDIIPESSTIASLESTSIHPTRAGEDTSRPAYGPAGLPIQSSGTPTPSTSRHSPVMTAIPEYFEDSESAVQLSPRDDYDGYGYGYGSAIPSVVNGGYGSPPEPTDIPPGGYGNPPPAIDKPTITLAGVPDPVTETVFLQSQTSSSVTRSPPTAVQPIVIVTQPTTKTQIPHLPEQNITVTVTAPKHTSTSTFQFFTPQVSDDPPPGTQAYVYTTISTASLVSHTGSNTESIVFTPTAHTPPRPVTDTNAADSAIRLNYRLMFFAAFAAAMAPSISYLLSGAALLLTWRTARTRLNIPERMNKNVALGNGGDGGGSTDPETGYTLDRHGDSEPGNSQHEDRQSPV